MRDEFVGKPHWTQPFYSDGAGTTMFETGDHIGETKTFDDFCAR